MTDRLDPVGMPADPGAGVLNIANALTALRLLLVPVFAWLLLHDEGEQDPWRWAAAAVFVVAVLTDRFDGELARRRGLVTDIGKIADPIADKALTGTALVGLSVLGELAWWVTLVVLVREIAITVLRLALLRRVVMPADRGGKIKTALQALAITLYLMPLPPVGHPISVVVMAVAVLVTVATGARYLVAAYRLTRRDAGADQRRGGMS